MAEVDNLRSPVGGKHDVARCDVVVRQRRRELVHELQRLQHLPVDAKRLVAAQLPFAPYAFAEHLAAEIVGQVVLARAFLCLICAAVHIADDAAMAQLLAVFYLADLPRLAVEELFWHPLHDKQFEEEGITVLVLSPVSLRISVFLDKTLDCVFSYDLTVFYYAHLFNSCCFRLKDTHKFPTYVHSAKEKSLCMQKRFDAAYFAFRQT